MSRAIDKSIDDIIEAFEGNITEDVGTRSSSLDNMGKAQLRAALTQLVFEIKEEIRNEVHQ